MDIKKIKIEATPTDKGLKNVYVRPSHAPYVHFRSITDPRVVYLLTLLKDN